MEELLKNWNEILLKMKEEYQISDMAYQIWIEPICIYKTENDVLYLYFDNKKDEKSEKMAIEHIEKRYMTSIYATVAEYTGTEYQIEFLLSSDLKSNSEEAKSKVIDGSPKNNNLDFELNPKYTFDTFVVGANNEFARAAAFAVAETPPGQAYNPLYIHGGPGLGKTHLMHAICHYMMEQDPSIKILYVTSEDFTNEVIENIQNSNNASKMNKLRDKYRSVDVLMIDDIQFVIGKQATQNEFFNTFNALHSAGKQIIITSDRPPEEFETLDTRIKSRFEWGLLADIKAYDYETRYAIIRKKIESLNISIPDDVVDFIATNIKSNVRRIEGAITKIQAYSKITNEPITVEKAREQLKDIISSDASKEITTQLIMETVASYYNVDLDLMLSTKRSQDIVIPRQIAMYLCCKMTNASQTSIGAMFNKNHSTVIHSNKKVDEELLTQEKYRSDIESIKNSLQNGI